MAMPPPFRGIGYDPPCLMKTNIAHSFNFVFFVSVLFAMFRFFRAVFNLVPAAALLVALSAPASALDAPLRLGDNRLQPEIGDWMFEFFTYRPLNCASPSVLLVFHGNGRGASSYRNSAKAFADEACFVVYSPLFDRDRFPSWSYHRGGLFEDGELRDDDDWTVATAGDMIDWIKSREGADTPIFMFGHSAGAQFLSRVVAYDRPAGVERIVLANPSTYVVPSFEWDAPYGFAGLPGVFSGQDAIRAYLEAPVTIFLGQDDTGSDDLTRNEWADRQGSNRLDRGRTVFRIAKQIAEENDWEFGWMLVEAPGVGHTARGMLGAREFNRALGFIETDR